MSVRILMLGDVVGRAGRDALAERLPALRKDWKLDALVVNGENAAGGFGLSARLAQEFFELGVDCITLGNHSFDQRDLVPLLSGDAAMVRPLNYPVGTPGRGVCALKLPFGTLVVVQVMGQLFMQGVAPPHAALAAALEPWKLGSNAAAILVDVHAEATSEKQALAYAFDGHVSAVVGTHTHVPTADTRILPGGTAFQSDLGMCGAYDSVIGFQPDAPVARLKSPLPGPRLNPASGPATLCGILLDLDPPSGKTQRVQAVRLGGQLSESLPRLEFS